MDKASLRTIARDVLGVDIPAAEADSIAPAVADLPRQYRALGAVALPPIADSPPTPRCGDFWLETRGEK